MCLSVCLSPPFFLFLSFSFSSLSFFLSYSFLFLFLLFFFFFFFLFFQISTAGLEASGTGNMKFTINGALLVGTLDGANIEIRDAIGHDNMFVFGLTASEVHDLRPTYNPRAYYEKDAELAEVQDHRTNEKKKRITK